MLPGALAPNGKPWDNYPRLQAIEAKADPRNRFRVNQNITPKMWRNLR